MTDQLYAEHPDLYDAIQSEWDYERDVSFVENALDSRDTGDKRLLDVGCGTGEHVRRFEDRGFDVTAVDPAGGMLSVARQKCDADFRRAGLPDLDVDGEFDVVVAVRGVVNHLPPAALEPALGSLAARLADGGVLVFDNSPLPPSGNDPGLDDGTDDDPRYVRVAQMQPREDGRLDWVSVTFGPDGDVFRNSRPMTPFADDAIADALAGRGLDVETREGYGPEDDRTVFVAAN